MKTNRKAVVIGACNIDIGGRSFGPLIAADSNPGTVTMSLGGVGRNIAHNMALLGTDVTLLTALGDDYFAGKVRSSCDELGIDLGHALVLSDQPTSTYLYICGKNGDMALAVSDMEASKAILPEYIQEHMDILQEADAVVIDMNLPEETLKFIVENTSTPIFADPVSVTKAKKLKSILGNIYQLKANLLEAQEITGIHIENEDSLKKAAEAMLNAGVQQVVITLGMLGMLTAERLPGSKADDMKPGSEQGPIEFKRIPVVEAEMKNANGAGDASMAALVNAYLRGLNLTESAQFASRVAAKTVESAKTINESIAELI